jgi:dTDP-4-dehydrorhamnose reductase
VKNIQVPSKVINNNSRIYVAGCGGMLGQAMYSQLQKRGSTIRATDINCTEEWVSYADVRIYEQMKEDIDLFKPDLIINLAALTDLEECEKNVENSWLTNSLGCENLGLIANQLDIPYVYISTAGIFGGEMDVYNDYDEPNPLSAYAKSKHYAEKFVLNTVVKHFVFRAGWMMGGGPLKDKKFINKIYKQICSGAKEIFVVDDKLGTPTYTHDFANGICNVVNSDMYGLYNQVCSGSASRYEVAARFLELLGLDHDIKLTIVPSDYFSQSYFAPRPASEKLVNLKLNSRNLNFMRDWNVCLEEYAEIFKTHYKKLIEE